MNQTIPLPAPQKDLAFPLMQALTERRSIRKWSAEPLSDQDLSNLLWAACGQTRPADADRKSKRTAPSACNAQEIRLYVMLKEGVFLYDETDHTLIPVTDKDLREIVGTQKMMQSAPLGLVFVADLSRMTSPFFRNDEIKMRNTRIDTGYISQNIYLYCAAAGLGTCALGLIDRDGIHKALELEEHQHVVLSQVVGYREAKP